MTFTTDTSPVDCDGRPNRINAMIAKKIAEIKDRIDTGITTPDRIEEARKGFDMSLDEWTRFQDLKSEAQQAGLITLEEANSIYRYLGSLPDSFNDQPVAVKVVLTSFFNELLTLKIKGIF